MKFIGGRGYVVGQNEIYYPTLILCLLCKLDVGILFVQVFAEFVDFVFVYSSDRIVNVA